MDLPDDVLQIIRAYAKPSEPYKMYLRVLKILGHGMTLDMHEDMMRKIKKATRIHYAQFRNLFLELEKRHDELVISIIDSLCKKDTSEMRKEHYFKLTHYACHKRDLILQLKAL
jgi:hypothetical protein